MSNPSLSILRAPSLLLASLLLATACTSVPARPPIQPGSSEPRVDPDPAGDPTTGPGGVDETALKGNDGGLTPGFLSGRDIKRAAVLLPFSHPTPSVRAEAESMLAGIELALFELGGDDVMVMPFDTAGSASIAEARADEAIAQGADIFLGPLFGANVSGVRKAADRRNIPVIAFSNDRKVAGGGVYLASIMPEEEVSRVVDYAYSKGVRSFVFLGPENDYGRQVEAALRSKAGSLGASYLGATFYDPKASADAPTRQVASLLKAQTPGASAPIGVLIPEKGVKMLSIAPLFPFTGVDMSKVRLLGTRQWEDSSLWREPALSGGIFASTDPENHAVFADTYKRIYGRAPTDLSAVAYDAAAMSLQLAADDNLKYNGVTDPDGFLGVNGLFRFRLDGTTERGLAVKQITSGGPVVLEKGQAAFTGGS